MVDRRWCQYRKGLWVHARYLIDDGVEWLEILEVETPKKIIDAGKLTKRNISRLEEKVLLDIMS